MYVSMSTVVPAGAAGDAAVDGLAHLPSLMRGHVDAPAGQCEAVAGYGRVGVSGQDVFLHPCVVAVVEVHLLCRPRDDTPGEMPEPGFAAVAKGRATDMAQGLVDVLQLLAADQVSPVDQASSADVDVVAEGVEVEEAARVTVVPAFR